MIPILRAERLFHQDNVPAGRACTHTPNPFLVHNYYTPNLFHCLSKSNNFKNYMREGSSIKKEGIVACRFDDRTSESIYGPSATGTWQQNGQDFPNCYGLTDRAYA